MNTTPNTDIYRAANFRFQQHGEEAAIHAAMKVDEMLEAGDMDGQAVWLRVGKAIEELQATELEGPVH